METRITLKDIEKEMCYCSIFRNVVCIGDSLSSGELVSVDKEGKKQYHDWFEYSWGQVIARKAGINVKNFSRGGMTAKEYMENFADFNRMFDPMYAAQAYVIAIGVNDLIGQKQELGSIADVDLSDYRNNKPTFAGYYAQIIQKYKTIQPRASFFLVTMPKDDSNSEEIDKIRLNMRSLMYDFSKLFSNVYVIDLYSRTPVFDREVRDKYMMNGHMTSAGYLFSAETIMKVWNEVIQENLNDFNDSCFVGTEMYHKL